mgnify:CR=1 FL=1
MDGILQFFTDIIGSLDGWLESTLQFDNNLLGLYNDYIAPIPELFKLVGAVFLGIIIVLGTASFVKKMLKLFLVLAVIIIIVMAVS